MQSNLDVWAIQSSPEELNVALEQIHMGLSIIYSNCTCDIRIGYEKITTKQFDTLLYNEESDVLIMLMRGGKATKEDMIAYLEERNMPYGEVTFTPHEDVYEDVGNIPELWFAREEYVLKDALEDSKSNGIDSSIYYPCVKGFIKFGYIIGIKEKLAFDKLSFNGIVQLDDKVILLLHQKNNVDENGKSRNIKPKKVFKTSKALGIKCEVAYDRTLDITINQQANKQKVKAKDFN